MLRFKTWPPEAGQVEFSPGFDTTSLPDSTKGRNGYDLVWFSIGQILAANMPDVTPLQVLEVAESITRPGYGDITAREVLASCEGFTGWMSEAVLAGARTEIDLAKGEVQHV